MNIKGERLLRERQRIYRKSGSVPSHIIQELDADTSSAGKNMKQKRNRYVNSLWGDPRSRAGKKRFAEYLKNLKGASSYLKDERSIMFFRNLPAHARKRIYQRLNEVDPTGCREIRRRYLAAGRGKKKAEKMAMDMAIKDDTIALEQTVECIGSPRLLKLMPLGGLKNVLALCVAAGHSREEVANMVKMDVSEFNALITNQDVKDAAKEMPNAIVHLANGMVLRDLMQGVVTPMTKEADQIAARRSKVAVEVSKESRERTKFSDEVERKRESDLEKRFGINRLKGEVIDADNKS